MVSATVVVVATVVAMVVAMMVAVAIVVAMVVAVALVVAMAVAMLGRRVAVVEAAAVVAAMVEEATGSLSSVSVASECGRLMLTTVLGFWARLLRWRAHCGHQIVLLRGLLLLPSRRAIKRL